MAKKRGIKLIKQSKGWDCGVACLAMVLNHTYGDISAMMRLHNVSSKAGMTIEEMIFVAHLFGMELARKNRSKNFLEGKLGILGLVGGKMDPGGHWAVYKAGVIICPTSGEIWALNDYLSTFKCRPTLILYATP